MKKTKDEEEARRAGQPHRTDSQSLTLFSVDFVTVRVRVHGRRDDVRCKRAWKRTGWKRQSIAATVVAWTLISGALRYRETSKAVVM